MSRVVRSLLVVACLGVVVAAGCGKKKTTAPEVCTGTGTLRAGLWRIKSTTSGAGSSALCQAYPQEVETFTRVLCHPDSLAAILDLPDSAVVLTGNNIQITLTAQLELNPDCTATVHSMGTGKAYSDCADVTFTSSISSLPTTPGCSDYVNFPCQIKTRLEATRTGDAPNDSCGSGSPALVHVAKLIDQAARRL